MLSSFLKGGIFNLIREMFYLFKVHILSFFQFEVVFFQASDREIKQNVKIFLGQNRKFSIVARVKIVSKMMTVLTGHSVALSVKVWNNFLNSSLVYWL